MRLSIALAQINTRLGDVHANLEKHLSLIKEARSTGSDLLVFPELSLTGYVLQDLVPTVARRPNPDDPVFQPLLIASQDIDLVVGFVDEDGLNFWGGSTIFDPNGELIAQGPYHEESLTFSEIDLNQLHRTRTRLPLLRDERTNLMKRELDKIIRSRA